MAIQTLPAWQIGPQCMRVSSWSKVYIKTKHYDYFYSIQPDCNLFFNMSKEDQKKVRQVGGLFTLQLVV